MAFDEGVAQRAREAMDDFPEVSERKMFGGIAFMVRGNMCCGVVDSKLMLRVGAEQYEESLALPHAREMDFTGKPMKGFVYIAEEGFESDTDLKAWIDRAFDFVGSLPAK